MPYAPGIEYRGDQYLFRGISSLGAGIGDAIRQYRDNKRESQAADAAFETLMQTAAPFVQSGQIPEDVMAKFGDLGKFSGLSATAKKAKLGQLGVSMQMLMQDADRRDRAADRADAASLRRSMFDLQKADSERGTRRQDATSRAVLGMAPVLDMPEDQAAGVMGPALVSALRENPEADALGVLEAMTRAQRMQPRGEVYPGANEMLETFDRGGRTGIYNKRTGQTMLDQDASDGQAASIRDDNGQIVGYGVRSGNRTHVKWTQDRITSRDRIALLKEKRELANLMSMTTRPDDRAAIQEQMAAIDAELEPTGKPAASPAPSAGTPPPRRRYNPATGKVE